MFISSEDSFMIWNDTHLLINFPVYQLCVSEMVGIYTGRVVEGSLVVEIVQIVLWLAVLPLRWYKNDNFSIVLVRGEHQGVFVVHVIHVLLWLKVNSDLTLIHDLTAQQLHLHRWTLVVTVIQRVLILLWFRVCYADLCTSFVSSH